MKVCISGASGALGQAFARLCAQKGWSLCLHTTKEAHLDALRKELPEDTRILCADLSTKEGQNALAQAFCEEEPDLLIQCAAIGQYGPTVVADREESRRLLAIDVEATQYLTQSLLQLFCRRDRGRILNVASMAAYAPAGPYMASYYAAKTYLLHYDRAVRRELYCDKSSVTVSTLCPPWMPTSFDARMGLPPSKKKGADPAVVASYALKQAMRGKAEILCSFKDRFFRFLCACLPDRWLLFFLCRYQNKKKGEKRK